MTRILKRDLLATLPPEWPDDPFPAIQQALCEPGQPAAKVVVLDDDPTGTATLYGIPVLTDWPVEMLAAELAGPAPTVYVVTNSRALPGAEAAALNQTLGQRLAEASRQTGRPFVVISRSDSTLRGHYPGEVDALEAGLGVRADVQLIVPAYIPAGRLTVGDVHYAADGDWLLPVGETEYARDASFGFRASNLRQWVEEKTGGKVRASDVETLPLDLIRRDGPGAVADRLAALASGSVCIANAASERDLAVVTLGAMQAEARGKTILYRSGPSLVPLRAGIPRRGLLRADELALTPSAGGLTVVGSYVPKSTAQVSYLLEHGGVTGLEVVVQKLVDAQTQADEVSRIAGEADAVLRRGDDVVIYTSRALMTGADADSSLAIGQRVSDSLVRIVTAIPTRPRYLLAKGGITSSDLAAKACRSRRALVLGQIIANVPVWQLGDDSRYPGLCYIIFPGNVGGPESIAQVVTALKPKG